MSRFHYATAALLVPALEHRGLSICAVGLDDLEPCDDIGAMVTLQLSAGAQMSADDLCDILEEVGCNNVFDDRSSGTLARARGTYLGVTVRLYGCAP